MYTIIEMGRAGPPALTLTPTGRLRCLAGIPRPVYAPDN
jgi:hypothetical protein